MKFLFAFAAVIAVAVAGPTQRGYLVPDMDGPAAVPMYINQGPTFVDFELSPVDGGPEPVIPPAVGPTPELTPVDAGPEPVNPPAVVPTPELTPVDAGPEPVNPPVVATPEVVNMPAKGNQPAVQIIVNINQPAASPIGVAPGLPAPIIVDPISPVEIIDVSPVDIKDVSPVEVVPEFIPPVVSLPEELN